MKPIKSLLPLLAALLIMTMTALPAAAQTAPAPPSGLSVIETAPPEAPEPVTPRDKARVQYNKGFALYENGNQDAALMHFEAALKLDPTYDAAREAIIILKRSRSQAEANQLEKEGNRHYNQKDYAKAAAFYQKALNLNPQDEYLQTSLRLAQTWLNYDIANKHYDLRRYDKAIEYYQIALKLSPDEKTIQSSLDEARAWQANDLGEAEFKRQNFDVAIRHFQEALKYKPEAKTIKANLNRAMVEEALMKGNYNMDKGNYQTALGYFESALRLDPDSKLIRSKWRQAHQKLTGGPQKAEPQKPETKEAEAKPAWKIRTAPSDRSERESLWDLNKPAEEPEEDSIWVFQLPGAEPEPEAESKPELSAERKSHNQPQTGVRNRADGGELEKLLEERRHMADRMVLLQAKLHGIKSAQPKTSDEKARQDAAIVDINKEIEKTKGEIRYQDLVINSVRKKIGQTTP